MINENLQLTTSIYNLFYKNPLFEYACFDKKGSASINLMIVGSGAVAYEVFKHYGIDLDKEIFEIISIICPIDSA